MNTIVSTAAMPGTWQAGFIQIMPTIETYLRFQLRPLPAERREEATQEAIAAACASYRLLAIKGRLADAHSSTLAAFAVNHVRNGRHLGGRQDSASDVMSVARQARNQFYTNCYDRYREDTGGWEQMAIEDRRTSILDLISFRVDCR